MRRSKSCIPFPKPWSAVPFLAAITLLQFSSAFHVGLPTRNPVVLKGFLPPRRSGFFDIVSNASANLHVTKEVLSYEELQEERQSRLAVLFQLLKASPSNAPTSADFTKYILDAVQKLEDVNPTPDEEVLGKLAGTWELLWTAQDRSSEQYNKLGPLLTWIK
jgi:PAP_fibrillin